MPKWDFENLLISSWYNKNQNHTDKDTKTQIRRLNSTLEETQVFFTAVKRGISNTVLILITFLYLHYDNLQRCRNNELQNNPRLRIIETQCEVAGSSSSCSVVYSQRESGRTYWTKELWVKWTWWTSNVSKYKNSWINRAYWLRDS